MTTNATPEAQMARINGMLVRAAITIALGAVVLLPLIG